jgi:hypothetical protein
MLAGQRCILMRGCPAVTAVPVMRRRTERVRPAPQSFESLQRLVLLELLRPPPWLALPPLLAISRCFAGSIAANPRFDPPLFVPAMLSSVVRYQL